MLDKLRIALVLLIIGAVSGTLIWGTHTLTYDRIQENRARARLAVYVEMFPELDVLDGMLFEEVTQGLVQQKITMRNAAGDLIGYAFLGSDTNAFGFIDVVIGIDPSGKIIDVIITDHSNTETYVRPLVANYFENFQGQDITDVNYDANTGATQTYTSVQRIIEAAKLLVAGDPVLEAYQSLFTTVERYEAVQTFSAGDAGTVEEVSLYDNSDDLVGTVYTGVITYEDETFEMGFAVNADETFAGIIFFDEAAQEAFASAVAAFDTFKDVDLEAIDLDTLDDEARINVLKDFASGLLRILLLDDEELARLLQFDFNAARAGESSVPESERLLETFAIFDEEDAFSSQVYIGETDGYGSNPIEMWIVIAADGTIKNYAIVDHNETDGLGDIAFDAMEILLGEENTDNYNQSDAYTGATVTGNAVRAFIDDALADFNERTGD